MKVAKASRQESDNAIRLAQFLESTCHPRTHESPSFPFTDDEEDEGFAYFDANNLEDLKKFHAGICKLSKGLMRVAFGYSVLVDNCCDPNATTLEWKPGLNVTQGPDPTPMVNAIEELRKEEGASVELLSDNHDFNGQPANAISVTAGWTNWQPEPFTGDTLTAALQAAVQAKTSRKTPAASI